MNDDIKQALGQLGIPDGSGGDTKPPSPGSNSNGASSANRDDKNGATSYTEEKSLSEITRRRGFFEAVRQAECPQKQLAQMLKEYEQQARDKIQEVDEIAAKSIDHYEKRILFCKEKLQELQQKLADAELYREANDPDLQLLIKEKEQEEQELHTLQQRMTEVRVKLGEAKAGIISKSLAEAEMQVRKALDIQKIIYDETWALNKQKFEHEKEHLRSLSEYFQRLYDYYSSRYEKINRYLKVLDVDGISPVTWHVLVTAGTIAFGAAGFFFSTFAGYAGFGNQDILSFILGGLIESAKYPQSGLLKVFILLGLIALVTGVSVICNVLLNRLKRRSEEEILSEVSVNAEMAKKLKHLEFQANLKSNNWYAFWLQLIPGVLIGGLLILILSQTAGKNEIEKINASSEGLIAGSAIAIALAGIIYLYVIKIVEPRLLKGYNAHPDIPVNWFRSNWELVTILIAFLIFSVCIIAIPYNISEGASFIPKDQQTRYAILLFVGVCLVGSMSFAYGVRSRGLIETNWYMERVMRWLNINIAYCTSPKAPELHNKVADEHGNIIRHVLKQLSFKATINSPEAISRKRRTKDKGLIDWIRNFIKSMNEDEKPAPPEPIHSITIMEPWEQHYFPHIVDELKAAEFEYKEKQKKIQKTEDNINDYKANKQRDRKSYETGIENCLKEIRECEEGIETSIRERSESRQRVKNMADWIIADLLDGFHLGIWYRENGMGPQPAYFEPCLPDKPIPINNNN